MDAQSSDHEQLLYNDLPPVLIAADSPSARERARRTVLASGLRMAEALEIEDAPGRIGRQAAASALWIELDGEFGDPLDRLLDQVRDDVGDGRYPAIVSARADLIDPLTAKFGSADVELLIDADEASAPPRCRSPLRCAETPMRSTTSRPTRAPCGSAS